MHTALTQRQQALTTEIQSVEEQISKLAALKHDLNEELLDVNRSLGEISARHNHKANKAATTADLYGAASVKQPSNSSHTNYFGKFVWSGELKRQMKHVFGFDSFRLCQEGLVCSTIILF
jgi:ATP-dependent DNA helicase Q1